MKNMLGDKFRELKKAIKNPPPERLAKIEYQSYLLQSLGVTAVCIILISKGFWYVIFAFVFSLGISYSQGMTAYRKYHMIVEIIGDTYNFEKDKSPTRKRSYIINSVFKGYAKWFTIIFSVLLTVFIIDLTLSRWLLMLIYPLTIFLIFILIYYFLIYWIANKIYKKKLVFNELKGGNKNVKTKKRNRA